MGSEWIQMPLEQAMDAIIDYRGKTPKKTQSGIPLITAKIVKNGRIDPIQEYIAEEDYDSWMQRGIPQKGDIVLTTEAPLGEVAQLTGEKIALAQRIITLRGKAGVLDSDFLKYLLQSHDVQYQLGGRASGTTVSGIKQSELRQIILSFPPLPEQKAIAHILGSLDDKIELNRKMNQTLEAMAQALFKSWFVDFDPVIDNALVAGNPIPDEFAERAEIRRQALANGTANREVAKDFPAGFRLTEEKGWVPEGWEVGIIGHFAELNSESWSSRDYPEQVKYVDLANAKNGQINDIVLHSYCDAPSRARRVLRVNDTVIGTVRPGNRSFAYVHEDGLTGSTGFAVLRPRQLSYRAFLYLCLTQDEVIETFAHLADGGAYPAIRPEVVSNYPVVIVQSALIETFDRNCFPFINKIGEHQKQIGVLSDIRDILLPQIISGEFPFLDCDKYIEDYSA